jgi:hypothetical protein
MRRAALVPLAAWWLLLAGCPLPQALPEYSAGTVTPPRILVDDQLAPVNDAYPGAVTLLPANCTTVAPIVVLSARIVDTNTVESVEARWFVNYDRRDRTWNDIHDSEVIAPNADPNNLVRPVRAFSFDPYQFPPPYDPMVPGTSATGPPYREAGVLRVVELVVSNGFDPAVVGTAPAAYRAPKPGFETQSYRWVFLTSSALPCP